MINKIKRNSILQFILSHTFMLDLSVQVTWLKILKPIKRNTKVVTCVASFYSVVRKQIRI